MNVFSKTLGVIVLYNLKLEESVTIATINKALEMQDQYLDLLVYDNSLVSFNENTDFKYKRFNIHYIHNKLNIGVSGAYNTGAKYARNLAGKKWILLLDQDTSFTTNLFLKFADAINTNPAVKLFAPILMTANNVIFSPCRFYFGRGFPLKKVVPGLNNLEKISPVNSGMLIDLDAFIKAGMYNENIRLDFSDFQFIQRFKKHYSLFFLTDATGFQDFSNNESSIKKLNSRYAFFCEGAKNFDRSGNLDSIQYFIVAFMRAVTLSLRTKSLVYFKTFIHFYIKH